MTVLGVAIYPLQRMDWLLLPLVCGLVGIGLATLLSATDNPAIADRQILYLWVGAFLMVVSACISWRWWTYLAAPLYMLTLLLLVAVALFGVEVNNSRRWMDLGLVTIQPSELAKISVPLMIAWFYCLVKERNFWQHIIAFVLLMMPALLVFSQPDLGTAVMIAVSGLLVIFLSGLSWWIIGCGLASGVLLTPFIWAQVLEDYQRARILSMLDPYQDPLGSGYHTIQSSIAVGSGGMWGKGWGQGSQSQLGFLPEKHTDFIFAVYAEEFGFVGCLLLLGLIMLIFLRMLTVAGKARDVAASLVAGSFAMAFFLQALVNLGMVSGVLPVVGLPLPLVSYGGTSLMIFLVIFGVMMSISRYRGEEKKQWLI